MSNLNIVTFQDGIHQLLIGVHVDVDDEKYFNIVYPTILNLQKETGTGRLTAALIPVLPEQLTTGESPVWQYPRERIVVTKTTALAANLIKTYTDMYQAATKVLTPVPEAQIPAKLF